MAPCLGSSFGLRVSFLHYSCLIFAPKFKIALFNLLRIKHLRSALRPFPTPNPGMYPAGFDFELRPRLRDGAFLPIAVSSFFHYTLMALGFISVNNCGHVLDEVTFS